MSQDLSRNKSDTAVSTLVLTQKEILRGNKAGSGVQHLK